MTTYKVLAPLVQLKIRDAAGAWVFQQYLSGGTVPDEVDPDNLQHHIDSGLVVAEDDPVAEVFAVPAGTPLPGRPPNVEVTEFPNTGQPIPPLSDEDLKAAGLEGQRRDGRPAQNAPKSDWVAYAVTKRGDGVSEEDARAEAESRSKADLLSKYGG